MSLRLIALVVLLNCLLNSNSLTAAPLDFDGDGISDTVTVSRQNDNSANEIQFHTILSSNNESYILEYGKRTDLLAPGDYNADGIWEFGLIKRNDQQYSWQIRNGSNSELKDIAFGKKNDIFLTGCNFDQDLAHELALIRDSQLIYYNVASESETTVELQINSELNVKDVLCADTNADGISEIYFLKTKKVNDRIRNRLIAYDLTGTKILDRRVSNTDTLFASIPAGETKNLIGLLKNSKSKSTITLINDQKRVQSRLKFDKFNYATCALRYNSVNEIQNTIIYMDNNALYQHDYPTSDTALLEYPVSGDELLVSINRYFTGNANPADPDSICPEIFSAKDGANGFLWKQSDFHPGVAIVFPASYSNQVFDSVSIMKDGEILDQPFFAGIANGFRQHWRSHDRASSYPDYSIIVANRGSETYCWQIEDSASRND